MSDSPASASSKAKIIAEAIWATGGPASECLGAVKNHIDARHPKFPWTKNWHAEIQGTKAALGGRNAQTQAKDTATSESRSFRVFSGKDLDDPQPETATRAKMDDVRRAGEFVKVVGGDIEQAQRILDHLGTNDQSDLHQLQVGLMLYAKVLGAVAGDSNTAAQVLDVFGEHFSGGSKAELPVRSKAA